MPEECGWAPWYDDQVTKLQEALKSFDELMNRGMTIGPDPEKETRLRRNLQGLDDLLKKEASHEMDKFLRLVCESGYLAEYRVHFIIVRYHYVVKGVRMVVSDGDRRFRLPKIKGAYYWVTWGVQKYIDAGWEVEEQF